MTVVCHNTITMAFNGASSNAIRVPHSTSFDADAIKRQLCNAVSQWDNFLHHMKTLSERKVKSKEAETYIQRVLYGPGGLNQPIASNSDAQSMPRALAARKVLALYEGKGRGAELAAARDTAWAC